MALPTSYLTSTKKLPSIIEALQGAQAPERVTQRFLEDLGFTATSDRLYINVFKALGLLSDTGQPQAAYHRFLDKSEGKYVLAEGVRKAYSDLFQLNKNAQTMSKGDVQAKMKTISQGQYTDDVLSKMATTFKALAGQADFSSRDEGEVPKREEDVDEGVNGRNGESEQGMKFGGLVYNINLHLPESRDPAVYDALFRSLNQHLR